MKKVILTLISTVVLTGAFAQSGTNSPYSQYGLGSLSDQSTGFNRGMNGVGLGMYEHNQLNSLNPASYSHIDSLSFIFDIGMSLQVTNFAEKGVKKNARNADLEYMVGGFRLAKNFGLAFGIMPYSNIGYSYSSYSELPNYKPSGDNTKYYSTITNSGSGGIHQAFLGLGYSPIKNLSVGFNFGYFWGNYTRTIANSTTDTYSKSLTKTYTSSISNYKLMLGAQYTCSLTSKDQLTLGATYTPGHKITNEATASVYTSSSSTGISDTITLKAQDGLSIPTEIGVGLGYNHANKLRVGFDYTYQAWDKIKYPVLNDDCTAYTSLTGQFKKRQKFNLGAEFCQNEASRNFLSRVRYRLGVSYTTPYLKINKKNEATGISYQLDGPSEIAVSGGFGIPISNSWNNRSILNISAQWVHMNKKDLINENTFRINVGITFNERWFAKWKFD